MRRFIRTHVAGATFFFTVNLRDRQSRLLVERIEALRGAFARAKVLRPFRIDAVVVLPEHLHAIWTLPSDDGDFSMRWMLVKREFTLRLGLTAGQVWQPRYWEHQIRDEDDLLRHIDCVHFNPVKHGWARRAADWPYSSFHGYVRAGRLPADWGVAVSSMEGRSYGE